MTPREGYLRRWDVPAGYRDWPQRSGGCRPETTVGRERTTVPGVKRAPCPVGSCSCATRQPRWGPADRRRWADREEGATPQRAQDDPGSEGRRPKRRQETGNRVTGTFAGWIPHNWSDTGVLPGPKRELTGGGGAGEEQ